MVHAHLAVLDAAVEHLLVEPGFHGGEALHGVALAGLGEGEIGLAVQRLAGTLGIGDPLVEVAVAQAVELERHAREARAAVVRREAVVHARLVDDGVQLGLHAGHGVDHAGQVGHVERVHRGRGRQLEDDGAIDGGCDLVHRGDALLGVEESPLPVHGHHLDLQRLDAGGQRAGRVDAVQGTVRVQLVGADPGQRPQGDDDHQRHGPDHQLQRGGVVPVGVVLGLGVRLAVLPGEEEGEQDHRDDDDQHQQRGGDDQLALLRGDVTRWIEDDGLAAAGEARSQGGRAEPCGPAEFHGFQHAFGGRNEKRV